MPYTHRNIPISNLQDMDLSIGFVVTHSFSGSPGSILRVKELSTSLSHFGAQINVYSPYPQDESWDNNVFFHRIPNFLSAIGIQNMAYSLFRRVLNNSFFTRHVLFKKSTLDGMINSFANNLSASIQDDIDIIQGEQEIAAAACVRLRKKLGIPVVASIHNIWSEELIVMGLIDKDSKEYLILNELEQEIIFGSDLVVVVSEEMAKYLENKHSLNSNQILVVPPGGRVRVNNLNERKPPFKVVYSGLVVQRAHLDLFIKSIPFVLEKYPHTEFYITRRGEELRRIRSLAKRLGVKPNFYWFPDSNSFYNFLASCHVGIVTSSDDLPRRMGPAVKLFDYLSVGLPVVANDIGGWTRIIKDEEIGILSDDDPQNFAKAILKILEDTELSQKLGRRGLELVKIKRNWDTSAGILLQKYSDLL